MADQRLTKRLAKRWAKQEGWDFISLDDSGEREGVWYLNVDELERFASADQVFKDLGLERQPKSEGERG